MTDSARRALADPRTWEHFITRIAENISVELATDLSTRLQAQITADLLDVTRAVGSDLAAQTRPLQDELRRAERILEDLRAEQTRVGEEVTAIAPVIQRAVDLAVERLDAAIDERAEMLASLTASETKAIDNRLLQGMLDRLGTQISAAREICEGEVARSERTRGQVARLLASQPLRWRLPGTTRTLRLCEQLLGEMGEAGHVAGEQAVALARLEADLGTLLSGVSLDARRPRAGDKGTERGDDHWHGGGD